MAERRLTVLISLSDAEHADELAHALAENDGMMVLTQSELEQPDGFDVVVTDAEPVDSVTPHVVLDGGATGANVHAVLPADAGTALIGAAARVVRAGYRLLPVEADQTDYPHLAGTHGANLHTAALTPREIETLTLLADGASNKVIARQLKISVHTAKFHVAAVLTKLHAQNRADAVAIGLRHGLIYL